jgi:hypothetical protein
MVDAHKWCCVGGAVFWDVVESDLRLTKQKLLLD